jgi:hypothetical protein
MLSLFLATYTNGMTTEAVALSATANGISASNRALNAAGIAASNKALTTAPPKYKKAPDAPKRFKSAFIIFSAEKHKEIKEDLAKLGRAEKVGRRNL